jgi:dynein heavy chain
LQELLTKFKSMKNCVTACTTEGLYKSLEAQQAELEICEKALAEFKESKRRAFPRFYFVSSNDLLDILSNGATHGSMFRMFTDLLQYISLSPAL